MNFAGQSRGHEVLKFMANSVVRACGHEVLTKTCAHVGMRFVGQPCANGHDATVGVESTTSAAATTHPTSLTPRERPGRRCDPLPQPTNPDMRRTHLRQLCLHSRQLGLHARDCLLQCVHAILDIDQPLLIVHALCGPRVHGLCGRRKKVAVETTKDELPKQQ